MNDRHPESTRGDSPPSAETVDTAQRRKSSDSRAEEKPSPSVHLPGIEVKAREVLGLDDLETLPTALAARAEQLWRLDGFAANVPFTNAMFVPMGPSADIGLLYEAVATVVDRHEALRTRLAILQGRAVQIAEDWKVSGIEMADILQRDIDG